jgi:hypothetical protein
MVLKKNTNRLQMALNSLLQLNFHRFTPLCGPPLTRNLVMKFILVVLLTSFCLIELAHLNYHRLEGAQPPKIDKNF